MALFANNLDIIDALENEKARLIEVRNQIQAEEQRAMQIAALMEEIKALSAEIAG